MVSLKFFPKNFLWGVATSSYQIEGAFDEEGRGLSIWDTFCREPGRVFEGHTGNIACDHYHLWEEDIRLMKEMGVNAYRFSISWPRIFPNPSGVINQKGIDFYSHLIDKLLESDIKPFPTLYHWDLPQYLQDAGGWSSRETCKAFQDYAYTVVETFSDRVQNWTTLNEPSVVAYAGNYWGFHAPGLHSPEIALSCLHHLLLAHGMALQAIKPNFDVKMGLTLNLSPVFPKNEQSQKDQKAAFLFDTYLYRSFLEALFHGNYPSGMSIPGVKPGDMEVIRSKMDYLGINYYTTTRVFFDENVPLLQGHAIPFGPSAYSDMWEFYPKGLREVIERVFNEYTQLPLYILENGTSLEEKENDQGRIQYLEAHLEEVAQCLKKEIPIKGYFAWSLLDNFEWGQGYSKRFGLVYVDFETQERRPKASARWYSKLIQKWKVRALQT